MTKFKIEIGRTGHKGKIEIDGRDISRQVRGFNLAGSVGEFTELGLSLSPALTEVEGDGQIQVDHQLHELLVSIGWTPPPCPVPGIEQATERVTIMASPEIIEQLKDWSAPLQVKIQKVGERWEMDMRTVTEGPALGLLKRL